MMGSNSVADFRKYKTILNNLYFCESDVICKGTTLYSDFWSFYEKYYYMQLKKGIEKRKSNERSAIYQLPLHYDKIYCVNFHLNLKDMKTLQAKLPPLDLDAGHQQVVTPDMIMEFNTIVHLFLDFIQMQKFKKLKKLRESQNNLPIAEYKALILETVQTNTITILAGDTGCGKSTQVPQFLMHNGFCNIACTQPRRIACISLCKRVSYETLHEFGSQIGYQIRFEKKRTEHSQVIFLTEGLLLRQISLDPMLKLYDVIILDEIHERHLQTDFLLGIIKCLIVHRPEIKIILMSATINIELFRNYFLGEAPVIQIPGRLYPIEIKYYPISQMEKADRSGGLNPQPYVRMLQLIDKTYPSNERGDILIFLSGLKEITTVVEAARLYAEQTNKWIILPLHSTLSISEQEKVFNIAPESVRKCIVSTNIAETSVTIDGIRFVVDSGKVKEMIYDSLHKMERLKEFWVSQASAEQRKGRAGRTGPGVCFRLYSEAEYGMFSQYSIPEVKRAPLDSVILQMVSLGLPNIRLFPFIDPPSSESLETSLRSLVSHSALTPAEELTELGRVLSQLPLDISLGKILVMGSLFHELGPVLSLVAAMSVQSPFTPRAYRDPDCVTRNKDFFSDQGDPFTLLATYREWLYIKSDSRENSRKWCKKRGLEEQRFYEITKLRQQFTDMLKENGLQDLAGIRPTTSNERMRRHGELSQLQKMKRDLYNEGPQRVKVLKMEQNSSAALDDGDERDVNMEIKDIDFKIRYDDEMLNELYKASKIKTSKDLVMLKVILCSGLYPNVAIADEHNTYKSSSDQFYHTRVKPFVTLHPNSVFTFDPQVLELAQLDIIDDPQTSRRYPLSSRHQLLTFISILETNKAYMISTLRIPAAPMLLLFSNTVDTNVDCSRIVCDEFIELTTPDGVGAQNLLFQAVRLRQKWKRLLELRVKAKSPTIENLEKLTQESDLIQEELSCGIPELYSSEFGYSMKRLMEADVKVLHKGYCPDDVSILHPNPFTGEPCVPNTSKGGIDLTEYITYDSLLDLKSSCSAITSFDSLCPYCDQSFYFSVLERFSHLRLCVDKLTALQAQEEKPLDKTNPNNRSYFCELCKKTLRLSLKDILRHKNNHKRL